MELFPHKQAGGLVLFPAGRIDHSNAEAFRSALEPHLAGCKPDGYRIVLDLSHLDYISSAGLRILMIAAKQVKSQQGSIVVAEMQPVVREIFNISKFTLVFQCVDTLDEIPA